MDNKKYIKEEDISDIIEIRNEPHIYAFSTETIPNYIKVGDTFRPIEKRLNEWRKNFKNLKRLFPNVAEENESIAKVDKDVYFRDYEVHNYLKNNNFNNLTEKDFNLLFNINNNLYYSNEFFKDASPNDIKLAIKNIKDNYYKKSNIYKYFRLSNSNRISYVEHWNNSEDWILRPNQKKVVENFVKKVNDGETELLMYAVMRFGKSFTAISCAKADVVNEWKKTVEKPKCFKNYRFLCDEDFRNSTEKIIDLTLNKQAENFKDKDSVVVFLTLQNLTGKDSTGKNIKKRLEQIYSTEFDLIIIDETHFGAWANNYGAPLSSEEDKEVIDINIKENKKFIEEINKYLKAKIKLHLSGTPYNLLYEQKFTDKNTIATCQFSDILNDKEKWDDEYLGKVIPGTNKEYEEYDNPYFGFPKMLRFAFNIPKETQMILQSAQKDGKWSLNDLFLTNKKSETKFIYENSVLQLLKAIDSKENSNEEIFSFLDIQKIKNNDVCKHIVMVLPFKYSCDAMELLLKNNKNQFKNLYNDNVEIINITGHNLKQKYNDINKVKNAISSFEKEGKKTISLTVNKMLTGVTVPEWDTMIMLKNTRSAQEYDQAIFRIQNQYVKELEEETNYAKRITKIDLKPQTILVDFDPLRMFELQGLSTTIANDINKNSNIQIDKAIERDLKFFPIISINANKIIKVTPNNIIELISEYNRNKSLVEQAKNIELDKNLLVNEKFKDFINSLSEKGIKSNLSGLMHYGEKCNNIDISNINNEINNKNKTEIVQETNNLENQLSKKEINIDEKKYQTFISSLLFFSFLTKSKIFTIKDIINKIENKNNDNENYYDDIRIFKNLGLNLDVIKYHYEYCNNFNTYKLNKKIASANLLSQDNNLSPEQRAVIALNNFSYISESEIVTPSNIAYDMCNTIGVDTLKEIVNNNGKILDIASKTGEFSVALYNLLSTKTDLPKEKIIKAIYCIPTSSITYELTLKVYDILGLNKQNIANLTTYSLLTYHKLKFDKNQNKNIETKEIDYNKIIEVLSNGKTFNKQGDETMKFDAIVGNPPYQLTSGKTETQTQGNSSWIYQYFQFIADKIAKWSTLIYPFGGWFDSPSSLGGLGDSILKDGHTISIQAYEGTTDRRAWYRTDKNPEPIFEYNANLSAGVAIVLRNFEKHTEFKYSNRIYSDKVVSVKVCSADNLPPNPLFIYINEKLGNKKLISQVKKGIFSVESNFVEQNPSLVSHQKEDWKNPIQLLTNDKSGSSGRATWYWTDKNTFKNGQEYFDCYKVVISSAYPKKSIVSSTPTIENVKSRLKTLVEILPPNSAFGRSRMALFMSKSKNECDNFMKYLETNFFAGLTLQEPNRSSTFGDIIPLQDFTNKSDIDWSKSVTEIDKQLYKKYNLTQEEIDFIEKTVKPME